MTKFADFYCLKPKRFSFELDSRKDARLIFGYTKLKTLVDEMLEDAQISGTPPKTLWWGLFGCGKTHHINYTEQTIDDVMPFKVVRFDFPEVTSKSLFSDLQLKLVAEVQYSYFRPLLIQQYREDLNWLNRLSVPADVRQAFTEMISNDIKAPIAWQFMAGGKIADPNSLGVTKKQLTEGEEFAAVIGTIAEVIFLQTGKTLLYLIDEAEGLGAVTNADAQKKWAHALRKTLDLRVGFVFAIAAERIQYLPEIIQEQEVWRRIGDDYIVALTPLQVPEISDFIKGLLAEFIDCDKLRAMEATDAFAAFPHYDADTYPFTQEALEGYARFLGHSVQNSKPSEILKNLQKVTHAAVRADQKVIDRVFLETNSWYH